MTAYYSEFDPKAAAWLRELIKQGHIADGVVDERDLWDVTPADLAGFTQVHLCAGIGVWSYALRRAGWPDDRPCWTGSFPCQPFSAAGKGAGFADERHLWPAGFHLIEQCRPAVVFGEQVASKDAEPWIDLVQDDLEAVGYGVGAVPFPSAGIGAPHIRDRLYWVAESANQRHEWAGASRGRRAGPADLGATGLVAHSGCERFPIGSIADDGRRPLRLEGEATSTDELSGGLALTDGGHSGAERQQRGGEQRQQSKNGAPSQRLADSESRINSYEPERTEPDLESGSIVKLSFDDGTDGGTSRRAGTTGNRPSGEHRSGSFGYSGNVVWTGPTNGLWRDADWLFCRDGKWRPVEPGTFPLAHGAPARVGCVCATCLEASAEGANDEDLRALRKISGQADGRVSPTVLQPRLPVGSSGEDAEDQGRRALAGSAYVPEHDLRDLRGDGREPSSPQGSRPQEQRPGEHPDTLSEVSQRGPSCERCGSERDLYEVTIAGNSRVARLRGYGNAINAEAAVAWIESYLEAIGERPYAGSGEAEEAAAVRA